MLKLWLCASMGLQNVHSVPFCNFIFKVCVIHSCFCGLSLVSEESCSTLPSACLDCMFPVWHMDGKVIWWHAPHSTLQAYLTASVAHLVAGSIHTPQKVVSVAHGYFSDTTTAGFFSVAYLNKLTWVAYLTAGLSRSYTSLQVIPLCWYQ